MKAMYGVRSMGAPPPTMNGCRWGGRSIRKSNMKKYVVRSLDLLDDETDTPLYWNNTFGWVDFTDATRFTEGETKVFNLPIGAIWEATI